MKRLLVLLALVLARPGSARAQDATTLTGLDLYGNLETLSVVAGYTGDDNRNATARVLWRPAGTGPFLPGHALVRLPGRRFAGSVLYLEPDTAYELRVEVSDPDGGDAREDAARTRPDSPAPGTGARWYVDAGSGDDAGPGSSALPFRTIQRGAQAAQPGDTVHVRRGVYREQVVPPRGGTPGAPLRFLAEGPGVIVDGSDPALETGAPWTSAGGSLWWTPFTGSTIYVAVDDTRVYDYQTLADLQAENGNIGVPGAIQGGFYVDSAARRLYLITPDHTDPAGHAIHVAVRGSAFLLDTLSDVVVEGFEMRYFGADPGYGGVGVDVRDTARAWVRRNDIHHVNDGVRVRRRQASENVIEENRFRDTGVPGWPWSSVKNHTPEATAYAVLDGHGNVVRCNEAEGSFNGVYTGIFGSADEEYARDTDVYGNRLRLHGDDGLELEGAQRNVRAWGNLIEDTFNAVSIAPVEVGPVFLVRNLIARYTSHAIKANNGTSGWVFFYHTTAIPAPGALRPDAQVLAPPLPFGAITSRNNIWEANRYVFEYIDTSLLSPVDLDHDELWTNDTEGAGRFVRWLNVRYPDLAALAASGTIEAGGYSVPLQWEDPARGDYRLRAAHPLVDQGVVLPGINERHYAGQGPDLGAFERGGPAPGCGGPRLLRNTTWPGRAPGAIFRGPEPGCPAPLGLACPGSRSSPVSLDPWGADCRARAGEGDDDDTWARDWMCGTLDPQDGILDDATRPLVFYQVDRFPSACGSLRVVKELSRRSVFIDCE